MITDFIKKYPLQIVAYVSILFIYTTDSIIPLVIYSVLIHMVFAAAIYVLYIGDPIVKEKIPYKYFLYSITETGIFLIVLGVKGHWYTYIVTCCQALLMLNNFYEKKKTNYLSKGN